MKKWKIDINNSNQRLDKYLISQLKWLNNTLIFKYIRQNKIKVNNKKVEHNYILKLDDEITIYFNENYKQIPIIYDDENILIVDKPTGIECMNVDKGIDLISILKKQLNNENLLLVHRLDTNTNGIVIVAKSKKAFDAMYEIFKNNEIIKYYQALVYGHLEKKTDTLNAFLIKDKKSSLVKIIDKKNNDAKAISTKYTVVKEFKKYSLLEIVLITGRTHQIRAHMNYINHPIVGEKKYIKKNFDKDTRFNHQALTAYKIEFKIHDNNNYLYYLNGKRFKLKEIDFLKKI